MPDKDTSSLLEQKPDGPSLHDMVTDSERKADEWGMASDQCDRGPVAACPDCVRNTRSQETPSTRGSGVQISSVVSWRPAHQQHNITTAVSSVSK